MEQALAVAVDQRLDANLTQRNILAITVPNRQVFNTLRANPLIKRIEEDKVMKTLLSPGGFRDSPEPVDSEV